MTIRRRTLGCIFSVTLLNLIGCGSGSPSNGQVPTKETSTGGSSAVDDHGTGGRLDGATGGAFTADTNGGASSVVTAGASGKAGSSPIGGTGASVGGARNTGGAFSTGGANATGGKPSVGGTSTGGKLSTGGVNGTSGAPTTGGAATGGDTGTAGGTPWPTDPPAPICDNADMLTGPATAPTGAVSVPAGDNHEYFVNESYKHEAAAGTVYYFQPGIHYLGSDQFAQIIPASNTTYIGAPGAIIDGQHVNLAAFTQNATNVRVAYLEIRNFGAITDNHDQGVVNHDAASGWTIEHNYMHHNGGAAAFVGSGGTLRFNCLRDNGQYGFQSGGGAADLVVDHNEVARNNQADWEARQAGCGCTGGCKFWEAKRAKVTNNWVHDNLGAGLWADYNNVEFLIENNLIEGNQREGIEYEISFNFMIRYNNLRGNCVLRGKAGSEGFPWGAIYISEAGGDGRAGSVYSVSEIHHNNLEDNWDGIVLWENSDRFCRPNENDVTAMCPFFDKTFGTRFKTQNVSVHDNRFSFDKQKVGCTGIYCGRNGIFSQSASNTTYPGDTIKDAITKTQNNHFSSNTYVGPWAFTIWDQSAPKTWTVWRGAPWNQDVGSTLSP